MEVKAIQYVRERDVTATVMRMVKEGYVINAVIPLKGEGSFTYDIVVSRPVLGKKIDYDDDEPPQRMPGIVQPRYK